MVVKTLAERIKAIRSQYGITQGALAAALGVNQTAISAWEKGRNEPTATMLAKLANSYGISMDWLLIGDGEMLRSDKKVLPATLPPETPIPARLEQESALAHTGELQIVPFYPGPEQVLLPGELHESEYSLVRRVSASLSAGPALDPGDVEELQPLAFTNSWLSLRRLKPDKCLIMGVTGDSMEPCLRDGDIVMINTADWEPRKSGLYAVNMEGELRVKRVQRMARVLRLSSDNPVYGSEDIPLHDDVSIRIMGRVVWSCHEHH